MKTGCVNRMRFFHTDSSLLMLSKSLRRILRSEGRNFLNDSIAEGLVNRVSLRCSSQNLQSIVAMLSRGKLNDLHDDHMQIMWLVSCSMECFKLYSKPALNALLRTAFIVVLHEVRITASEFKSREFKRAISFLIDVFPDSKIEHEKLRTFRDKAVSIIRNVSKLFRESRHRAAMTLAKDYERRTSWPGLVAVLRKEAKKLSNEYSILSGGNAPADLNREMKPRNSLKSRSERALERDYLYQDFDDFDEDVFVQDELMDSDSDEKHSLSRDYRQDEDEAPNSNFDHRQVRTAKLRERHQHSKTKARSRKDSGTVRENREDHDEVEIGSVRHGPRRGKAGRQDDQDSLASELGGLGSQDFPSAVVSSKTDDIRDDKEQEEDMRSVEESSEEHLRNADADFGESVTLSDRLEQAKLHGREACVPELRKSSLALGRLGPDDPIDAATEDKKHIDRKLRSRRKQADERNPREASPFPESEGVHAMKRRKRNLSALSKTRNKRQRQDAQQKQEDKDGHEQKVRRGRFTPYEDGWLIEGIKKYGWGAWTEIVSEHYANRDYTRNPMSLKDRARTLGLDPMKYPRKSGARGRPSNSKERVAEKDHDEEIDEYDI